MRYLILVNTKYPYRVGETFLESEIKENAGKFSKTIIFPVDVVYGEEKTRTVEAENVDVRAFETEQPKLRKIRSVLLSLLTLWKRKGSLKERFFDGYFEILAKRQAKKIINILEEYEFSPEDQIILYSYWFYIPARIIIEIRKYFEKNGIATKTISRAHRFDIYEKNNNKGYLPQREYLLKEIDRVYACSKDGADYLRERYETYKDKITVGLLGTYDYGIGTGSYRPFNVVSCSRVTSIKRVQMIADAILDLIARGYDINWTHIGDGPEMDLVKKKVSKRLETRIVLRGGISNAEVFQFYRDNKVDLFVNASTSEGLPVSIMEAISFGIPSIATNVGGTREIVVNGVSGQLVNCDITSGELADHIEKMLSMQRDDFENLRRKTRKFWEENYSAVDNYSKFAQQICEI